MSEHSEIGEQVQNLIIGGRLLHADCAENKDHGCVIIWTANSAEQIGAAVDEWANARNSVALLRCPVPFPPELLKQFEGTSFCPHDTFGRTGWNTLRVEYDPGSESEYPSADMYQDYHVDGAVRPATRPFADWGRRKDAEFVKAVIDWLQSMTQAKAVTDPSVPSERA